MVEIVRWAEDIVGESPVWSEREQALYWVDIGGKRLHRLHPASGQHHTTAAPDFVTSIGLRAAGGMIVGLTKDVVLWDGSTEFRPFVQVEPNSGDTRLNEGRVAPDGSFWVGTMQNNLSAAGEPIEMTRSCGAFYRITSQGDLEQLTVNEYGITNTMAWTDDSRFICADTLQNQLFAFSWDRVSGTIEDRRAFGPRFTRGLPDGSCLDCEGYLWNCRVAGGGCVVRFAPDGTIDQVIDLPCSWPTSCTYGGPNLDTLYVTSARFTMSPEHLAAHPQEGALFAVKTGTHGKSEHLFLG